MPGERFELPTNGLQNQGATLIGFVFSSSCRVRVASGSGRANRCFDLSHIGLVRLNILEQVPVQIEGHSDGQMKLLRGSASTLVSHCERGTYIGCENGCSSRRGWSVALRQYGASKNSCGKIILPLNDLFCIASPRSSARGRVWLGEKRATQERDSSRPTPSLTRSPRDCRRESQGNTPLCGSAMGVPWSFLNVPQKAPPATGLGGWGL